MCIRVQEPLDNRLPGALGLKHVSHQQQRSSDLQLCEDLGTHIVVRSNFAEGASEANVRNALEMLERRNGNFEAQCLHLAFQRGGGHLFVRNALRAHGTLNLSQNLLQGLGGRARHVVIPTTQARIVASIASLPKRSSTQSGVRRRNTLHLHRRCWATTHLRVAGNRRASPRHRGGAWVTPPNFSCRSNAACGG